MFTPKTPAQPSVPQAVPGAPAADGFTQVPPGETNFFNSPPALAVPAWPLGSEIEIHFHLSTSPHPQDVFSSRGEKEGLPSFVWDNIVRHLVLPLCPLSFKIETVF